MELTASGLPIFLSEDTNRLEFLRGITCGGGGGKNASDMGGLLMGGDPPNPDEHYYDFYRDIVFEKDRPLFQKYDFRYDITAIMPGTVNGECKKTSGHYHGYIEGQSYTYPEVYEVLRGECMFVLQKSLNFDRDEEPQIDEIIAVRASAGQAIVIPPFYGHCSVNVGEGVMLFSNIAVVSCPMFYAPVKRKHGLAVYVTKVGNDVVLVPNPNYTDVPEPRIVRASHSPALGICPDESVYQSFVEAPDRFGYLLRPEKYIEEMMDMLR